MFSNYLKIGLRNIQKEKLSSIINIAGRVMRKDGFMYSG